MTRARLALLPPLLALIAAAPAAAAAPAPGCAPAATQVARGASATVEVRCVEPLTGDAASDVALAAAPAHGTATVDGSRVGYANDGTGVLDRFTLTVRRAPGAPAATLTVEVGIGTASRPSCGVPAVLRVRPGRRVSGRVSCVDSAGAAGTLERAGEPGLGVLVAPSFASTGAFRFDAAGAEGDTSFAATATTAAGSSVPAVQPITVTAAANATPVCQDRAVTVRPGSTRTLALPCSDADDDPVAVTTGPADRGRLGVVRQAGEASNATVTFTAPDADEPTHATFTFTAADGQATSAPATVDVTVDPAFTNTTPSCAFTALSLQPGATVDVATDCTDVDADPIAYALVAGSARHVTVGAPVTTARGTSFPVTVDADYTGEAAGFDYTADDGQGGSGTGEVQITVGGRPLPACRAPGRDTLRSGRFVSLDLSRFCSGATRFAIADGSVANGRIVSATASGAVQFQASADAADGQTASFAFVATNAAGAAEPVTVAYDSGPNANRAPDCSAAPLTHVRLGATRDVLLDCTDADGDPLTATVATADRPARGTATVLGSGRARYTAPGDVRSFPTADPFAVTVSDGFPGGATRIPVAIAVEDLTFNSAPVCTGSVPVQPRVKETRAVVLSCSDADGDRISAVRLGAVSGGTVAPFERTAEDGSRWTSRFTAGDTPGPAGFDVEVADEREFAPAVRVGLEVREAAVNAAPTCRPQRLAATAGIPVAVDLTGSCTDLDGDALTASIATLPRHGALTADGGVTRFLPEDGFEGADVLGVDLDDGHGGRVGTTITFDVTRPDGGGGTGAAGAGAPAAPGPDAGGGTQAAPGPVGERTVPSSGGAGPVGAGAAPPRLRVTVGKARIGRVVRAGLRVVVGCDTPCTASLVVTVSGKVAKRLGLVRRAKRPVVVVRTSGTGPLVLRFTSRLAKLRRVPLTLAVTATGANGATTRRTVRTTLRR